MLLNVNTESLIQAMSRWNYAPENNGCSLAKGTENILK